MRDNINLTRNMAFLPILLSIVTCFAYIKEGQIYELTSSDYDLFFSEFQSELRAILFYSPFLNSVKSSTIQYFLAGKELQGLNIKLAKIDISHQNTAEIIERYPGIQHMHIKYCLAHTTQCKDYTDGLDKASIVKSLKSKLYTYKSFNDIEDFEDYISKENTFEGAIIGVFEEFSGEKYNLFIDYAKRYMDLYKFALIKDEGEWTYRFNLTSESIVIAKGKDLHSSFYDPYYVLSTFNSSGEIENFVNSTFHPFVTYVSPLNIKLLSDGPVPLGVLYVNFNKYYSKINYFVEKIVEYSQRYVNKTWSERKYQFAVADTKDFTQFLNHMGLTDDLFILFKSDTNYYKISEEAFFDYNAFKPSGLYSFYKLFEQQQYPRYYKSAPAPKNFFENGIKIAVASTYRSLIEYKEIIHGIFVFESTNTEAYHNRVKIIEEIAEHYKNSYKIEFVKIDSSLNTLPENLYVYEGGSLFFAIKNKNHPEYYDAAWNKETIIERIESKYLQD